MVWFTRYSLLIYENNTIILITNQSASTATKNELRFKIRTYINQHVYIYDFVFTSETYKGDPFLMIRGETWTQITQPVTTHESFEWACAD
jgi:hypothetical protein